MDGLTDIQIIMIKRTISFIIITESVFVNACFSFSSEIFYYANGMGFPGQKEFKGRVQFIGDINKRDVSIQLNPAQFSDNGTFFCDVKNPPDVTGTAARTEVRVVLKGGSCFQAERLEFQHLKRGLSLNLFKSHV